MIFIIAGSVLGLILGSLSLALAERALIKKSSFWGRSCCPHCKKVLRWYDLFPVLSYLFLRGQCQFCHQKISPEYPLVEILMATLIGYLFWQSFHNLQSIFSFQFIIFLLELLFKTFTILVLIILAITDLKKTLIPDRIVIPAIKISIIFIIFITIIKVIFLYYTLSQNLIGKHLLPPLSDYFERHAFFIAEPLIYGIILSLLFAIFFQSLIKITKGKGMGGGDVKLGAFMGLTLGFPNGVLALFLGFLIGALFSVGLILIGKKKFKQTIPFGPFLVTGSLIALFWGQPIINWYLNLST